MSNLAPLLVRTLGVSNGLWIGLLALGWIPIVLLLIGKVPFSYNIGNVATRWVTTFMTAMAFTLVVGLLTVMMAGVNGMYDLINNSGKPENVLVLAEGATDEGFSNMTSQSIGDISNLQNVARLGAKPLASPESYIVANQVIDPPRPDGQKRRFLQVRGIDDPEVASQIHEIGIYDKGSWWSDAGVRDVNGTTMIECAVGEGIARDLWNDPSMQMKAPDPTKKRLAVGDVFRLRDRDWYVVGIMKSSGKTFDSEVWAKQQVVGPLFGKTTYTSLLTRTSSPNDAKEFANYLKKDYGGAQVAAFTEPQYFEGLSATNLQFLFAAILVTVFIATGGIFGVMNTMFAAISQRTKDIGVLRILGYRRRDIVASFLLESVLIAIIGGVIGCLIGCLWNGYQVSSVVGGQGGGGKSVVIKLIVDQQVLAVGLLLTLGMGIFGGLIPALSAMRLTALKSLR